MNTTEMLRKSFPVEIKQADARTFTMTISTGSVDRDGDRIDPQGWQLQSYRTNPIILWQHDKDIPPIGRAMDVRLQGDKLVAVMESPPKGISPLADEIAGLMAAGFLHSTSVGFLPITFSPNGTGQDIHEAELLEFSVVNIPSQVEARVMRCAGEACDTLALKSWLGQSCGCDDTYLDIVPSTYEHYAKEAGARVAETIRQRLDQTVEKQWLEIIETYEVDEQALAVGVASAMIGKIAAEAAHQVQRQIRYYSGKVD